MRRRHPRQPFPSSPGNVWPRRARWCRDGRCHGGCTGCAIAPLLPLAFSTRTCILLAEPQHETEGIASVEVVAVQALVAHKAQVFVQRNGPVVGDLRFQHDLSGTGGARSLRVLQPVRS